MNAEAGFQLSDLAGIVQRRVAVMGGVALVVFLVFYWVAMALPNQYESYATVLVEPQSVAPELVKAGVREILNELRAARIPTAVATSSRSQHALGHLGHAGLLDNFAAGLSAEEIVASYPPLRVEDIRAATAAELARAHQRWPAGARLRGGCTNLQLCQSERRVLITLDVDFANVQAYDPKSSLGVIVLRLTRQDRQRVLDAVATTRAVLEREPLENRLWIVEGERVRIRA